MKYTILYCVCDNFCDYILLLLLLEFAVPAWSPWLEADKEVLEKVQRRAVQMVSGLKAHTYEDRLKELGLTTLEEKRHQADMAQTYKIVKEKTW